MTGFNYPEVGRTRNPEFLPDGYNNLHYRTLIGHGREVFKTAGDAVVTFRMHRAAGVNILADADRANAGVTVECSVGFWPFRVVVPCEVVWNLDEPHRIGFAYGTLSGHPECGEESFVVDLSEQGAVWFTVTAFSRPGRWYTRLAGPVIPPLQHAYARRCGRVLRQLALRKQ